ncbi:MAG TPA: hypothetical protein VKG90_09685, partial [Marmoricola sp.]|nr:hypothetical protein [Marmoricola sp.]
LPEGDTRPGVHPEPGVPRGRVSPGARTPDDMPESLERVHGHSIAPAVTLGVLRRSVSQSG